MTTDRMCIRRRAVPASVPVLRERVQAFAAGHGLPEGVRASAALAVTEACTNAVLHAYLDAPEPGEMELLATVAAGELVLEVCDDGRGMMPRPDSPGLGMGLPIIAQMTDRFEMRDRPGRPGVCLRMHFALEPEPAALAARVRAT